MAIYITSIAILIFVYVYLLQTCNCKAGKCFFCTFATFQIAFLSGLRHISIGADTMQYKIGKWDIILHRSWKELLSNLFQFILHGYRYVNTQAYNVEEPLYDLFEKTCQIISANYQVYLVIVAFCVTIPLSVIIYRYSKDPLISYMIYYSLFWNFMGITGICQTLAIALSTFIGLHFLKREKWLHYIIIVLAASLFHKSAFLALLILPVAKIKLSKLYNLMVIITFGIVFLLNDFILQFATSVVDYGSGYGDEPFAGYTYLLIYFAVILLTCWKYETLQDGNAYRIVYNSCFIGLLLIPIGRIGIRASQYFTIYLVILLPEMLNNIFKYKREIQFAKVIAVMLMLLLFFNNDPVYKFFWQ